MADPEKVPTDSQPDPNDISGLDFKLNEENPQEGRWLEAEMRAMADEGSPDELSQKLYEEVGIPARSIEGPDRHSAHNARSTQQPVTENYSIGPGVVGKDSEPNWRQAWAEDHQDAISEALGLPDGELPEATPEQVATVIDLVKQTKEVSKKVSSQDYPAYVRARAAAAGKKRPRYTQENYGHWLDRPELKHDDNGSLKLVRHFHRTGLHWEVPLWEDTNGQLAAEIPFSVVSLKPESAEAETTGLEPGEYRVKTSLILDENSSAARVLYTILPTESPRTEPFTLQRPADGYELYEALGELAKFHENPNWQWKVLAQHPELRPEWHLSDDPILKKVIEERLKDQEE